MASDTVKLAAIATVAFGVVGGGLFAIGASAGINPLMTDYDGAARAVEAAGFTGVKPTGYGWFSCGVGESADWWRTSFTATNQNGQQVEGVVCSSVLKGSTIRFD